jgi:hypothetical protein
MSDLINDPHHSHGPALGYWEEQRDKLQDLALRLLFLKPKAAQPYKPNRVAVEEVTSTNPKGKLITVNDWAKAKGIDLTLSQATEVGMRAAKLYEAKYGMPPAQVTSWEGPRSSSNYLSDMRRPWKSKPVVLPKEYLNMVGVYPKAVIERAWKMVLVGGSG